MNAKIYNGNVQPNPKEFKIWVNDEGIIKTWNGTEWIEQSGGSGESGGSGSGSGSEESIVKYYEINASADNGTGLGYIFPIRKGVDSNGNQGIGTFVAIQDAAAVAYMPLYVNYNGELKKLMTPEDANESGAADIPEGFIIKEISQDEFYNLEA